MPKSEDLVSNFGKPISNLKERYMRNFLKITKLMLYDPKAQVWEFGLKIFNKKWEIVICKTLLELES